MLIVEHLFQFFHPKIDRLDFLSLNFVKGLTGLPHLYLPLWKFCRLDAHVL
jgi:hypothetical protein